MVSIRERERGELEINLDVQINGDYVIANKYDPLPQIHSGVSTRSLFHLCVAAFFMVKYVGLCFPDGILEEEIMGMKRGC